MTARLLLPLATRPTSSLTPLTGTQQFVLKLMIDRGGTSTLRMFNACYVASSLDVVRFREGLGRIYARHESLRLRIVSTAEGTFQQTDESSPLPFEFIDASAACNRSGAEAYARQLAQEFAYRRSDVRASPNFEALLIKISESAFVFLFCMDHLFSDAISMSIVDAEIWQLYSQSPGYELTPIRIQFPDFCDWQHKAEQAWMEEHLSYWTDRFGAAAPTRLLCNDDHATDGPVPEDAGRSTLFLLSSKVSLALQELARRERTLLSMVMLCVYSVAMSRWCGRNDLIVDVITHGRHYHPALQNMVGYLASQLRLRIHVGDIDALGDLLRQVCQEFDAAFSHYDPGCVQQLFPNSATDLVFDWMPMRRIQQVARTLANSQPCKRLPYPIALTWPLTLVPFFYETPAGIAMTVQYRPDLVPESMLRSFWDHIRTAAEAFAMSPS